MLSYFRVLLEERMRLGEWLRKKIGREKDVKTTPQLLGVGINYQVALHLQQLKEEVFVTP